LLRLCGRDLSCKLIAGFMHSSYTFANESQVTKAFPDMSSTPPNALIRFVQKGLQYIEMEANLKEV
jgi:transducin (beta)-like 1